MKKATTMREYGVSRLRDLLDAVVYAMHAASKLEDPESVHKMRVSIRRFQQALRVFNQYVKKKGATKVRKELRKVMRPAGELRNRDIALEFVAENLAARNAIDEQRAVCRTTLHKSLATVCRSNVAAKWRQKLGIDT